MNTQWPFQELLLFGYTLYISFIIGYLSVGVIAPLKISQQKKKIEAYRLKSIFAKGDDDPESSDRQARQIHVRGCGPAAQGILLSFHHNEPRIRGYA